MTSNRLNNDLFYSNLSFQPLFGLESQFSLFYRSRSRIFAEIRLFQPFDPLTRYIHFTSLDPTKLVSNPLLALWLIQSWS